MVVLPGETSPCACPVSGLSVIVILFPLGTCIMICMLYHRYQSQRVTNSRITRMAVVQRVVQDPVQEAAARARGAQLSLPVAAAPAAQLGTGDPQPTPKGPLPTCVANDYGPATPIDTPQQGQIYFQEGQMSFCRKCGVQVTVGEFCRADGFKF